MGLHADFGTPEPAYTTKVVMDAALVLLSLLLLHQSPYSTADAPRVKLMNAAKDGAMMPVAGIGTGSYNRHPTGPEEYWTDDVAEKAIAQWLEHFL